ncbi:uncharacterized protein FFNC_15673 [Fusarium fujikuroi]|nr:uncharacterized protein FFNC_15673 [Fusarium fujikuroi]
MQLLKTRYSP